MTQMGDHELGPWEPLPLPAVSELMAPYPRRWWISGGHALELALRRSWREHEDTDVSVLRQDAPLLLDALSGWEIHVAAAGVLRLWHGEPLRVDADENNLWCRRAPDGPWEIDVTISHGDDDDWAYRRDPGFRLPWRCAVLTRDDSTLPFLAPELQMLFKSKGLRPKDHLDAEVVIPELTPEATATLRSRLPEDHPWLRLLRG